MPTETIPDTMPALRLAAYEGLNSLSLKDVAVPSPQRGEVLVRVIASPVNPSDMLFTQGHYRAAATLPVTPGFEGCGVVVASGGGILANALMGKRVATGSQGGDGMWATYCCVDAAMAMPMRSDIPDEQAACAIVNPLTAMGLFEPARRGIHKAFIQTAAASQLGQMLIRLACRHRIAAIHVVHREGLVEVVRGIIEQARQQHGDAATADQHVLDSSADDFDERLSEKAAELDATYAVDAVAGETSARLLAAMPDGSTVCVYGVLSGEAAQANPRELIFRRGKLTGYWLKDDLDSLGLVSRLSRSNRMQKMLTTDLSTSIKQKITLEEAADNLGDKLGAGSEGKTLIVPGGDSGRPAGQAEASE